jgi:hypothetical protein
MTRGTKLKTIPVDSRSEWGPNGKPKQHNVCYWSTGLWTCGCKGWIFKYQKLNQDCFHIERVKLELPSQRNTKIESKRVELVSQFTVAVNVDEMEGMFARFTNLEV